MMEMKEASFGLVWYDHCIDVNLWILLFRSRVGHLDETWGRGRKHEEWVLEHCTALHWSTALVLEHFKHLHWR